MKIKIQDLSDNGLIPVWGAWGKVNTQLMLERINYRIKKINQLLREV